MKRFLFLSDVDRRVEKMRQALCRCQKENILDSSSNSLLFAKDTTWNTDWLNKVKEADAVVIKWMGKEDSNHFLQNFTQYLKGRKIPYVWFSGNPAVAREKYGFEDSDAQTLDAFLTYEGMNNYYNLWVWLDYHFGSHTHVPALPEELPWCGIYYPGETCYTDLEKYCEKHCRNEKGTIGVLFYRYQWVWKDLAFVDALIHEIEKQGYNPICVFADEMPAVTSRFPSLTEYCYRYFCRDKKPVASVIIRTLKFALTTGGLLDPDFFKTTGIVCIEAYTLQMRYQQWLDSVKGMSLMGISINVEFPEIDGVIHGDPIATREENCDGQLCFLPMQQQIQQIVHRAGRWITLQKKENAEKKVVIVFHNSPPTNACIGSAAGLDSIESVRLLLNRLKASGYTVEWIPENSEELIAKLTEHATNDRAFFSAAVTAEACKMKQDAYINFFDWLPEKVRKQMEHDWGRPPGEVFTAGNAFVIPGVANGNVFLTVQPPRGFGEDPGKILHSPWCAPTHHYLAFYEWLRTEFQADAVVHVGTHGSLEWLPGKSVALSEACYPLIALEELPNIYPYFNTIVGEGIQAKRRSAAVLIGYLTPPMGRAELYDDLAELMQLLEDYRFAADNHPDNLTVIKERICDKVKTCNLENAVREIPEQDFQKYVDSLHIYLTDIKNMEIHTGLHILGTPPMGEDMYEFAWSVMRLKNGDVPAFSQVLARKYNAAYYQLLEAAGERNTPTGLTNGEILDRIHGEGIDIIREIAKGEALKEIVRKHSRESVDPSVTEQELDKICGYIKETLLPNIALTYGEMENLLHALDGWFVEPAPGGAPTSGGASLLPTGRNFFGIDVRRLPTPAAWEIGKQLADQVIERYVREEGKYPEKIGLVLWSGPNLRSHGQCLAEFLYLLGVKPVWEPGSQHVTDLEVIPLTELKRPRIDVTGRISGLFRDMMEFQAAYLDKAVQLAGSLKESPEQNYVRKHILEDADELKQSGMEEAEAWREASYRIFGSQPGVYGAGVSALLEARNWETLDDIADVYVTWGSYAYGQGTHGICRSERFRKQLSTIDVTIKNEDHNEIGMLNSDDYNAFHGGMIAAVRSLRGKAPRSYCGDSADRSHPQIRSLKEQTDRLFRGEAVNPKYIEGMMRHGYRGAAEMAGYVAVSFGWDATSKVLDNWMYEEYARKYALDETVRMWMKQVNPWALQRIFSTLLEAKQRGLWQADEETLKQLKALYLSIEGELEEHGDQ